MVTAAKCGWSIIADDCGDYSCGQGQTGDQLDCWSGGEGSWWIIECGETRVIAVLRLLIVRCTAEKRGIFHTHSLITDLSIEFVHKVCLSYEFNELKGHQWLNLIEEALNEGYLEGFIVKVVMFDDNAQEFSIVFLKTAILLLADL